MKTFSPSYCKAYLNDAMDNLGAMFDYAGHSEGGSWYNRRSGRCAELRNAGAYLTVSRFIAVNNMRTIEKNTLLLMCLVI